MNRVKKSGNAVMPHSRKPVSYWMVRTGRYNSKMIRVKIVGRVRVCFHLDGQPLDKKEIKRWLYQVTQS